MHRRIEVSADDASYDFNRIPLDEIYEALHEEYVWALNGIRHYTTILQTAKFGCRISQSIRFLSDLSEEREINDILTVTDVMITDYSSDYFRFTF